jgi:hypothetical protein
MTVQPVVRVSNASHLVATWDRVFINVWRGEVTPAAVTETADAARAWRQGVGGQPWRILMIIERGAPPPDERARALLGAFFREVSANKGQPLIVAEGSAFRVAWVRGVVLAVSALVPSLPPFDFASSLLEAGKMLESVLTPAAGGAAGLVQAVEHCRANVT